MLKQIAVVLLAFLAFTLSLFSAPAMAAAVDLSTLTAAVDFSTTTTALLGVAAAIIVVYIAWKAAKMVVHAVRSA